MKENKLNKNPFKIPKNYFEELNNELNSKIIESTLPKKTGYKTPNNYFENLNIQINEPKIIFFKPSFFVKIAAIFLIMISIVFFINKNSFNNNDVLALNNEDLEYWMEYDADYIETEELLENIDISENFQLNNSDILEYFENTEIEYSLNENDLNIL